MATLGLALKRRRPGIRVITEILAMKDTFDDIRISKGVPYWHFLCVRGAQPRIDRRERKVVEGDAASMKAATIRASLVVFVRMFNERNPGIPGSVAMKLTWHKSEAAYRRYAIVSEADLTAAVRKLGKRLPHTIRHTLRARAHFGGPLAQLAGQLTLDQGS